MLGGIEIKKEVIFILFKRYFAIINGIIIFLGVLLIPVKVNAPISATVKNDNASIQGEELSTISIIEDETTTKETPKIIEKKIEIEAEVEKEVEEPVSETITEVEETEPPATTEPETTKIETTTEKVVETSTRVETKEEPTTLAEKSTVLVKTKVSGTNISITDSEYNTICCVVMREAGAGSFDGCAAVAQCILDGMLYEGKSATYVLNNYGYYPEKAVSRAQRIPPNETVKKAVTAVFYNGYRVTSEPIIVYYSPANMPNNWSNWHEQQVYVCSYDGNKFFKYPGT